MSNEAEPFPDIVDIEITDSLDLHSFHPRDVKAVVTEYLKEAHKKGFPIVRIIHGKGIGVLRRTVESILARQPSVISFAQASEAFGGWGATIVHLAPKVPGPSLNFATGGGRNL